MTIPVQVLRSTTPGNVPSVAQLTANGIAINEADGILFWLGSNGAVKSASLLGQASQAYVQQQINALINGSPTALDTLKELADALGDDANYAATTATALGNRLRFDAAQTLTGAQRLQGRQNLGVIGAGTLAKSASYSILAADAGYVFEFGSTGVTLTLPLISAVPDGFCVGVVSTRATNVTGTLAAAGSNIIDSGLASIRAVPGQHFLVMSDGVQWRTYGRSSRVCLQHTTLTSGSSLILTLPPGYDEFEFDFAYTSTTTAALNALLSFDSGATYLSAASYTNFGLSQTGTAAGAYITTSTNIPMTPSVTSAQYYGARGRMRLSCGIAGSFVSTWDGDISNYGPSVNLLKFGGYVASTGRPTNISITPSAGTFSYLDMALYGIVSQ